MCIRPRVVIVETHPNFDSGPDRIRTLLEEHGYDVVNRINRGSVPVLTAVLSNEIPSESADP